MCYIKSIAVQDGFFAKAEGCGKQSGRGRKVVKPVAAAGLSADMGCLPCGWPDCFSACRSRLGGREFFGRMAVRDRGKEWMGMVRDKRFYWDLFIATFQLSAFTVGGGFVIVPLMRRKFIREKKWLDEDEMLDLTAIAQSAPGSIAINASILLGYRLAGLPGVVITILGTVLPPLMILSLVSLFYAAFKSNEYVVLAMKGMQAGVAAIILDVVITMGKNVLSRRRAMPYFIMAGSFLAVFFFSVNVFVVIIVCGGIGVIDTLYGEKLRQIRFRKKEESRRKKKETPEDGA